MVYYGALMPVPRPLRPSVLPRPGPTVQLGVLAELMLVGGLLALALAVRWPNLLLSPQFPSVGATVLKALDIADGRALPLADQAPYLGGPFMYLLAFVFKLFGPSVEATLLVPWAIGGLTIVPTYLLGRELGGRAAGLLGAALLATSAAHTVVTSHVPLSHSLTPFIATTTLWLLARAVVRVEGGSLALAGLGAGLSLQTHPTIAPLLSGAVVAAFLARPSWSRTRWPYLAVMLVLTGYGTLFVHHIQTHFEVVGDIQAKEARYLDADTDPGEDAEHGVYVNNLERLSLSLARLTSGAISEPDADDGYLRDPSIVAYAALGLGGLVLAARRGNPLLLLALLAAVLLPPLLSGKYKPVLDGRYLMPLVPVMFVGIGLVWGAAARALAPSRAGLAGAAALAIFGVVLVFQPLTLLADFYEDTQENGLSNALYLSTRSQVRAAQSDEPVLLDARLRDVKSVGGGNAGSNFAWLLAVSREPAEVWHDGDDPSALVGRLAILHRATADRLDEQLELTPLDGRRSNGRDRQSYRAYLVGPRPT